jgi:hypothetical protein
MRTGFNTGAGSPAIENSLRSTSPYVRRLTDEEMRKEGLDPKKIVGHVHKWGFNVFYYKPIPFVF